MVQFNSEFLTTDSVPVADSLQYWEDLISRAYVDLTARGSQANKFSGQITLDTLDGVGFSLVEATAQSVIRTAAHIRTASEESLLISIQRHGAGIVKQDGRTALLRPGDMCVYDSSRPYQLQFDAAFRQLVVQVPRGHLMLDDTSELTAKVQEAGTPGALVANFLVSMREQLRVGGASLAPLLEPVMESLRRSLDYGKSESVLLPREIYKERALAVIHREFRDPAFNVDKLAKECHLSVRSLHRLFSNEGVAEHIRKLRIRYAQHLLAKPEKLSVGLVAHRSGFRSESGFIRAFRALVGTTPRAYSFSCERPQAGTNGQ